MIYNTAVAEHCTLALLYFFFFNDTATTEIYTLSLHDALPICARRFRALPFLRACFSSATPPLPALRSWAAPAQSRESAAHLRSEEHTSELQSRQYLVCRLLLEKKKRQRKIRQGTDRRI